MKQRKSPIRTMQHKFEGNKSGYIPVDTKILVLPDYIDETSEGGIVLTSDTIDQNELAITEGWFIDHGQSAFRDWYAEVGGPFLVEEGSRIVWAMYAGQMLEGDDGKMYRLINDTDIVAERDS